jgi:hypothetical protein
MTPPFAGQPGHGRTAFVRRQPVRIVNGRFDGGCAGVFELICPGCGDDPYLDYTAVPPRLQWLRGPRALGAALAAYHEHIGASPRPDGGQSRKLRLSVARPALPWPRRWRTLSAQRPCGAAQKCESSPRWRFPSGEGVSR